MIASTLGSLCANGAVTNAPRLRLASDTCSYLVDAASYRRDALDAPATDDESPFPSLPFPLDALTTTFLECVFPGTLATRMSSTLGPIASIALAASSSFHANVLSLRLRRFHRMRTSATTAASLHASISSFENLQPLVV